VSDQLQLALAALGLAAALAFALTPLAARLAVRVGMVDRPGGRRRHARIVPLGGGVAVLVAIVLPALLLAPRLDRPSEAILAGAVAIGLVGLVDDRFGLPPAVKLAGQIAAASIPVAYGVTIDHFTFPFAPPVTLGPWQYPVTVLWIVALVNIVNFIDGMDGLAAGFGAIAAGTFALLALSLERGDSAVIAAALCGACLGFLPHNFHPARVFLGDAGALVVGFVLAAVSVEGVLKTTAFLAVAFPLVVLFVPMFDTSFVVLKRLKHRQPVWRADANHLHHRFAGVGWSQRQAALLVYAWCLALSGFALAVHFVHYRPHGDWSLEGTIVLLVLALLALAFTGYVVCVLEIVKLRHVQLLGLGRDLPGSTPLVALRRARREIAASASSSSASDRRPAS
jgi:UDP-GlcNAc:undecaprenyl-phosphate GlcNAc-1-phosphate transferase